METQRRLAGMANNKPKPYIDAGMLLVDKLMAFLDLSGWKDGHPMYTHSEIESINRKTSGFQKLATEEMGAENHFHPTLFQDLRRV